MRKIFMFLLILAIQVSSQDFTVNGTKFDFSKSGKLTVGNKAYYVDREVHKKYFSSGEEILDLSCIEKKEDGITFLEITLIVKIKQKYFALMLINTIRIL